VSAVSLAATVLGDGGLLSRVMPDGFEHRPEQLRMAEAATRALGGGGVLLVEAGTGTGKTLAYLTAAIAAERRVVVSTGTRNLQDQILGSDIPLLERALGRALHAVCLKGLGNYLCHRKLDALARSAPLLGATEAELLERILEWATETETGDRAELEDLPEDVPLWRDVCADAETRLGPRCPFHEVCFVTRARRAAEEARIIVVNHHLFFADLALRESAARVLPDYDCVVFDEAHQIDAVATEFFGYRVGARRIDRLAGETRRAVLALEKESGKVDAMRTEPLLDHVTLHSRAFFSSVACGDPSEGRSELRPEDLSGEAEASYWRLDTSLEALAAHLEGLPSPDESVAACCRRAQLIRADLSEILGRDRRSAVYWKEPSRTGGSVGASPVDVSDLIRDRVFYSVESVVLTSATLTAAGSFAYVRERLGIDFDAAELVLPPPFDFRRQAALWLPRDAPDPRDEGFSDALARLVLEGCQLVRGGVLALFTSYKVMHEVAAVVRETVDRPVRVQGERPRHTLLAELRGGAEPILLLATASFWEGVDVPGEALEHVIITRLPFASPGDPVVAARLRLLEDEGRSPFREYQLPQAALALKQGFGRLIRSRRDRGVVTIADRRIQTMRYGEVFLRSLPRCTVVETEEQAKTWWAEGAG